MYIEPIKNKKEQLRKQYKEKRINIENNIKILNDNKIYKRIISLDEYKSSNLIFTYVSVSDEVDTREFILKAISDKKAVAVPRCIKDSRELEFYRINSMDDLKLGYFNIMEPIVSRCERVMDLTYGLCVVPGLSFDKSFNRLGYGGGYYDRFLNLFDGIKVGLCYEICLSDLMLPHDDFDKKVDIIITENRIISSR